MTPQSSAVVTAIIALARSLGLRVIAEGVENLRQMEVLHRLGCGVMQGFLFSRPQPPEDIETWLQQTVLPRKAPWIGKAGDAELPEALRAAEGAGRAHQACHLTGARRWRRARRRSPGAFDRLPAQLAKAALRRLVAREARADARELRARLPPRGGRRRQLSVLPARAIKLVERLALRAFDVDPAAGAAAAADLAHQMGLGRWEHAERVLQAQPQADPAAYASLIERIVRGVERGSRAVDDARARRTACSACSPAAAATRGACSSG